MAYKKDRVAEAMRAKIISGEWPIGESIGDMFSLAKEFNVSFGTVRAAEQILVGEGLLSEIRMGIPTTVIAVPATDNQHTKLITRLRALQKELGAIADELEAA